MPKHLKGQDSEKAIARRAKLRARARGAPDRLSKADRVSIPVIHRPIGKIRQLKLHAALPEVFEAVAHGTPISAALTARGFSVRTFMRIVGKEPKVATQYQAALDSMLQVYADEIITISDDAHRDTIIDEKGNERADNEWINRTKLRVDSRKWLLSKMKPERFGDSLDHATQGGQKDVPWPVLMLPPLDPKP